MNQGKKAPKPSQKGLYLALDVLERKPGALAGSTPLAQWRTQGRWPNSYDQLWQRMNERSGRQTGTREMISLLHRGQRTGRDQLTRAITQASNWDAPMRPPSAIC